MTWDVEVATAGDYQAEVYYTCREGDVGSKIELSLGGSSVQGEANEAHDPPEIGAEFDRVPRGGESYVKDFRPLRLGVVRLAEGRGELTLRALEVPGERVIEVRAIMLTRLAPGG